MCVGEGSRWAPRCLLAATQGLLQEIPALQHFLHTPRGPETSPDVVFLACPASAPMAQHRDNRRSAWVPAGSGAQHPSAISGGKRRWEKRAPEPSKAPWPLISTDQTCPTGEAQRGSNLPEGNCWFSPSERRVTPQGRATPGLQGTAAPLPKHSSKRCQKPLSQRNLCLPTLKAAEKCAARVEFGVPASAPPNCHLGACPQQAPAGNRCLKSPTFAHNRHPLAWGQAISSWDQLSLPKCLNRGLQVIVPGALTLPGAPLMSWALRRSTA